MYGKMLYLGKVEFGFKQVAQLSYALVEQRGNVLAQSHLKSKVSNFPGHILFPFPKDLTEVIFDQQAFFGLHHQRGSGAIPK